VKGGIMRIAFAADDERGLDAEVSQHFGRCRYYIFVDLDGEEVKEVRAVHNPFYYEHGQPGQVPEFIYDQGAKVIIAGGMGPRAIDFFRQLGVRPITGASGTVREVLEAYLRGKLAGLEPCHEGPAQGARPEDEVSRLKEEVASLSRQLEELQERLTKLGG